MRMVDRITLAMRRMNEALRHSTEEHDASVLTNGVEALDSKRAAEPPSRRAAEPPSRPIYVWASAMNALAWLCRLRWAFSPTDSSPTGRTALCRNRSTGHCLCGALCSSAMLLMMAFAHSGLQAQTVPDISITATPASVEEGETIKFTISRTGSTSSALEEIVIYLPEFDTPVVHDGSGYPVKYSRPRDVGYECAIFPGIDDHRCFTIPAGKSSITVDVPTYPTTLHEQDARLGFFIRGGYPQYTGMNHYWIKGPSRRYVTVRDGPDVTPDVKVTLSIPDNRATEGDSSDPATVVLTLTGADSSATVSPRVPSSRGLIQGESLKVPLQFSGGTPGTDFTLSLSGNPKGVTFDASTSTVTFTGPASGASASTATLKLSAPDDPDADDATVTVSIPLWDDWGTPKLTAARIPGSASGARRGDGRILLIDPDTPPPVNSYAALIAKMVEWRNDPKWKSYKAHTDRWDRALLAFGQSVSDSSLTPMTAAEAQAFADRGWTRWVEVAKALQEIESSGQTTTTPPAADPEVSLSAGSGVSEGASASFTVTATPAPSSPLAVTLTVGQSGDYAASGQTGTRQVTVPTGGSVTVQVATVDDAVLEANGSVSATVSAGTGYTVAAAPKDTASVAVADDDTPVVGIAAGNGVTEGSPASFTITASPAPAAPLTVALTVGQSGDYAASGQTGTRQVTVPTGGSVTVQVATVDDAVLEANGSVSATVSAGTGYTVAAAPKDTASVAVADDDTPVVGIAAGNGVTEGSPASFTITASPAPAAPLTVALTVGQSGDYAAAGETGAREVTVPTGGSATVQVATADDSADEPDGSVSVTVGAGTGYAVAASPKDTALVTVADDDAAPPVSELTIGDVTANESDRLMWFTVTLSPASDRAVSVDYRTRESTPVSARKNDDFLQIDFGDVTFSPGETSKRFWVYMFDDNHDEGSETFEVVLSRPTGGARIADGVGVGTIVNSDPMPAAWLARFSRTVAEQALGGIKDRMAAPRTPGFQATVAGTAVGGGDPSGGAAASNPAMDQSALMPGFGGEGAQPGQTRLGMPSLTAREALLGTSFSLTDEQDGFAFWGRASQSSFDGREGTFSLDGEAVTALLGTDYARGRWLMGLALMQSEGSGDYRDTEVYPRLAAQDCPAEMRVLCDGAVHAGDGAVEASLTAALPYAALQVSERLQLWGVVGYGVGSLTLTPETSEPALSASKGAMKTDLDWQMVAPGLRGDLFAPGGGMALAVVSDALWMRAGSDRTRDLAATESEVTRLRLGLEGSWRLALGSGAELIPRLETGVRHDGGDAETGFGWELGGGLGWTHARLGLSLHVEGRVLLAHESEDFRDWGLSGSLRFDPAPETDRGLSASLTPHWGTPSGGLAALLGDGAAPGLSGSDLSASGGGGLDAEVSYGLAVLGGRATGTPYLGMAMLDEVREMRLGWRLALSGADPSMNSGSGVEGRRRPHQGSVQLGIEGTRREGTTGDASLEHGVMLRLSVQ